jgi:subtilisin family serine protease
MVDDGSLDEGRRPTKRGVWQGEERVYAAGRIIVRFKQQANVRALGAAADSLASAYPDIRLLRAPSSTGRALYATDIDDIPALARRLSRHPAVAFAEPDFVNRGAMVPDDPRLPEQWALRRTHAIPAWYRATGVPEGIVLGVVDSGIAMARDGTLNHPDLNDQNRYILGTDFVDGGDPRDRHGHGTHVTGIAAAETSNGEGIAGVNWRTPVYICRVFDASNQGFVSDIADAVEEIVDFAVSSGLRAVINLSGGAASSSNTSRDACQYVDDNGMILCVATGNAPSGQPAGAVWFPAAYSVDFDGVIAVGSTDIDDSVSSFSNFGPEVTVVAPGNGILSTTPTYAANGGYALGYDERSGTSMATPMVSGLCSLIWGQDLQASNVAVRARLMDTARKLGPGDFANLWGFGRIDMARAVRASPWLEATLATAMS